MYGIIMALVVLGVDAYFKLGVDLFPKIEFPFVSVTPVLRGAAPEEVESQVTRRIEEAVLTVFEGWDYEEIIPPLFDYADVFTGDALSSKTYSFVGRDGSVLALRPDFTSLLAKIAAGRLHDRPAPIRLYYSGEVVRYEPPKAGRQSELFQMGLEHLGGSPGPPTPRC